MYIDINGKSQIKNHTTGEYCDMDWKERGWSGKNAHCVVGTVKTAMGEPRFKVNGKFTEAISI